MSLAHKPLDIFSHKVTIRLFPATLKIWDHALVGSFVAATSSELNIILVIASAIKYLLPSLL